MSHTTLSFRPLRPEAANSRLLGLLLVSFLAIVSPAYTQWQAPVPEFGVDLNFNHTDVMMGGQGGISFPSLNASLSGTFKGRIGSKRVLQETDDPHVLMQYRERRYLLGLQAEKRFLLNEFNETSTFGAFVGGFGGMTFSDYRGTKASEGARLAGSLLGGVYLSDPDAVILRLGYMYLPLQTQNVFNHRIVLSFTVLFS